MSLPLSKAKFIRANLIVIIGGLIANAFSLLVNVMLLRQNSIVANQYVYYNSLSLILAFPSLVFLRAFSVYGWESLEVLKSLILKRYKLYLFVFTMFLIISITLIYLNSHEKDLLLALYTLILSIITIIVYALRGLFNYDLKFTNTTISFNIETGGRLLLGYFFVVFFNGDIHLMLLASIISMTLSALPLIDISKLSDSFRNKKSLDTAQNIVQQSILISLIFTLGLEFIANFDVSYIINALQTEQEKIEFNALQVIRKIIFHGTVLVVPIILSVGSKSKNQPIRMFLYTIIIGSLVASLISLMAFIFRETFFFLINKNLVLTNTLTLIVFLVGSILMALGYLLSNWLFSQGKLFSAFLPLIIAIVQFVILTSSPDQNINSFVYMTLVTNTFFYILTLISSLIFLKFNSVEEKLKALPKNK